MKHPRSIDAGILVGVLVRRVDKLAVIGALAGLASLAAAQETVTINFDGAGMAPGVHAGNIYLDRGVRITTCQSPSNVTVGGTITLTELQPWFEIWQWGWAVSEPNYLLALDVGTHDILLNFTVPVSSVELDLDLYPFEVPNVVRLIALDSTGGNSYTVLSFVQATDEVFVPPPTHMSIDLGGAAFSAVLFQTLDELEGFDNLKFETTGPIPTPPDEGPPGPAPPGSGGWAGGGGGGDMEPPSINENSSGTPDTSNPDTPGGDNKPPDAPSSGDLANDNSADVPAGNDGAIDNNPAGPDATPDAGTNTSGGNSGGGACGAPVAIVMLCGMVLLRLLNHSGAARGKS